MWSVIAASQAVSSARGCRDGRRQAVQLGVGLLCNLAQHSGNEQVLEAK